VACNDLALGGSSSSVTKPKRFIVTSKIQRTDQNWGSVELPISLAKLQLPLQVFIELWLSLVERVWGQNKNGFIWYPDLVNIYWTLLTIRSLLRQQNRYKLSITDQGEIIGLWSTIFMRKQDITGRIYGHEGAKVKFGKLGSPRDQIQQLKC